MMRDLDAVIDEALSEEERELLKRIGDEPGFFGMAFGLFRGPLWWANLVMLTAQALLFLAGAYAAWMFFEASEPVAQLRWGLPAAVLLLLSAMIKMALLPEIHANRLMRELKRIELQLARGRGPA
jgi:NADH:ubiquinone oxidoreductase subunit H